MIYEALTLDEQNSIRQALIKVLKSIEDRTENDASARIDAKEELKDLLDELSFEIQ